MIVRRHELELVSKGFEALKHDISNGRPRPVLHEHFFACCCGHCTRNSCRHLTEVFCDFICKLGKLARFRALGCAILVYRSFHFLRGAAATAISPSGWPPSNPTTIKLML
eukprot:TRINITY_DN121073_c0_g1_i1.p1 TRINITY_DN121073_c0_g1~~TRINITY_DN121073_c0_g1_i1.p1  ORF type:complete len:110 (+),score=3.01 TRINITY_DN121073_c0_g1_i1:24-353(+)